MGRVPHFSPVILLCFLCFLVSACKTTDFADARRLALKNSMGLSCEKQENCWEQILAGNPPSPKFSIAVPPSMGLEYAKMARDRFGDKVQITRWDGYFISRSEAINPAFADALKRDPFILEIRPTAATLDRLKSSDEKMIPVPIEVRVRTSLTERAFTAQATINKDLLEDGMIRAHRPLATEIFDWMEKEVRQREKMRAR